MQASEIEYRSGGMNTSLFGPNAPRQHADTQTDPKITRGKAVEKRSMKLQTEKLADMYKPDWVNSKVFKRALRAEAEARKIPFHTLNLSSDEGTDEDDAQATSYKALSQASLKSPPPGLKIDQANS
jgi:hypothetical protein